MWPCAGQQCVKDEDFLLIFSLLFVMYWHEVSIETDLTHVLNFQDTFEQPNQTIVNI